ncbi:MAG TPA: hypothetical protein PKE69_01255 [Pyrinomonadaceae bacterium]|nr:hypothetical protein [Pyrinomonadaceae bacterium]
MEVTKTPTVIEQHIRNAVDYGWAMAVTATPEQIREMMRQNELFDKGLEICINCGQESRRGLEDCESCGESKIPF